MNYQLFQDSTMPIFIDIMVWVAFSFFVFEIINLLTKDRFYNAIEKSKKTQVLWGALLGMIPGCGGALLLVPLYNKRKVGLGALAAAFIATFGDAAFVILAEDPIVFLHLSWMSLLAGVIFGYIIQYSPLEKEIQTWIDKKTPPKKNKMATTYRKTKIFINGPDNKQVLGRKSWIVKMDRLVLPMLVLPVTLYIMPGTIASFFDPSIINYGVEYFIMTAEWLSYGFTLFLMIYYIFRFFIKRFFVYHHHLRGFTEHTDWSTKTKVSAGDVQIENHKGIIPVFHNVFTQLVQITFWVWVGFFSFEIIYLYAEEGLHQFFSMGSGWIAILIATAVGMIPGCGAQIALATFYFSVPGGGMIGAALLANSINQDGDAAFPLMVTEPKASIAMRFLNVVPAILFATIYWGISQTGITMPI